MISCENDIDEYTFPVHQYYDDLHQVKCSSLHHSSKKSSMNNLRFPRNPFIAEVSATFSFL